MKDIHASLVHIWTSFLAFLGVMTRDEWLFVIGISGSILSVIISWIYKHKDHKLKKQYYERCKPYEDCK